MHFPWSAPPFCIYKGNFKKYKGKFRPIFIFQKCIYLFVCECPSHRTAFLKFRRVERHPSWGNCMQRKLHAHAIFCQIACACNWACNFMKHAILARWVSFNSSGLHECCPMSWPLTSTYIYTVLWVKDQTDFSFVFFEISFVYTKRWCTSREMHL